MKQNFEVVLPLLLKDEGGYTNDPDDSGGPTKYGITIIDVQKYVKKDATAQDVRNLTLDQAKSIYKSKYWDALSCDNLASGVDYTVFDYGVNSGLGRPRKALQQFNSLSSTQLIDAINNERTAFLKRIGVGKNTKFLKGWLSRVDRVRNYSKLLYNKKDNVSGPVTGAATVSTGVLISQYFHQHQGIIILGALVTAFLVGAAIHVYRNKNG